MNRVKTEMSKVIYRLKHEMGEPVTWTVKTDPTYNYDTGATDITSTEIAINKAIVFPIELIQKAKYSITYLASNKNFVYDGLYDRSELAMVVDLRDLSFRDFDKHYNDTVTLQNGNVLEVSKMEYYPMEIAIIVTLKVVTNG